MAAQPPKSVHDQRDELHANVVSAARCFVNASALNATALDQLAGHTWGRLRDCGIL